MNDVPFVFGEVLYDCFEDGARVLGGAPFNVAWHLQAFGAQPLFISRVGDDTLGHKIRDTMQRWGMHGAGLQLDADHSTGEVRVTLQGGQPSFDILADRAYDFIDSLSLPPGRPALIYHGSLALRSPVSAATYAKLLSERPAPVFIDVNLRDPWWWPEQIEQLLYAATWVKINDHELEILMNTTNGLRNKAERLLEQYDLELVIVTRGKAGAFALQPDGTLAEVTPKAETRVVDTVGAGDAFASVCILGLLHQWSLELTLERAQDFASLIVGQRGATVDEIGLYQPLQCNWQLNGGAAHKDG